MKRFFLYAKYAVIASVITLGFNACSDDDDDVDDDTQKEETLTAVVKQYVDNAVIVTYKSLADETITLYNALVKLKADKTNANVNAVSASWIKTRDYWELSEAWLYGPASDFGIDDHIDTWPSDIDAISTLLKNSSDIQRMSQADGDVWISGKEPGLLGFHGIEYVIYEEGKPKDVTKITDNELIYAVAVAGDLRNKCFQLEAAWVGLDNVTAEKRTKLEAIKADLKIENTNYYYGEAMKTPGLTGTWKSATDACETIIEGCKDIADEVGALKIGNPYTGEDVNYIESPYSYNSKVDFIGNIESIRNAYMGGVAGKRGASISAYIKIINPGLDKEVQDAINNAVEKIDAIPFPFAKNFTSNQAKEAMEACLDLDDILTKVQTALRQ
jgi:Predicted periplasmic lipoprotein